MPTARSLGRDTSSGHPRSPSRTQAGGEALPHSGLDRIGDGVRCVGHGIGRIHCRCTRRRERAGVSRVLMIDQSPQLLHPNSRRIHTRADRPTGSTVVHSRPLSDRSLCDCPERTSSARAHFPNRVRRDFDGHPLEDRQRRQRRLVFGFAVRALRPARGVPAAATAIDRFSRPSQRSMYDRSTGSHRVIGRISHKPGLAVVYRRSPATPIFANIESDSDGRMFCGTRLPSAGLSAGAPARSVPSPILRWVSRIRFHILRRTRSAPNRHRRPCFT